MSEYLKTRVKEMGFYGMLNHWDDYAEAPWLPALLDCEEQERAKRSLERRVRNARLGRFKSMADFDWSWPKKLDRQLVEELFTLSFLAHKTNIIFVGPNGVGKSMLAKNIAHQALMRGYTVRATTASEMLAELSAEDSASALQRRIKKYAHPNLLLIDEVGYLSYDNRAADLLFEVLNRRYQEKPTLITTNKPFAEWNEVFPNATCVVTLVDRLVHNAELVQVEGQSYRLKEAKERTSARAAARKKKTQRSKK